MSPKTILYVEDNEVNRRLVRDLLKRTSSRLLVAPDGEAGMAIARQEQPDLILTDVPLPPGLRHRGHAHAPGGAGHGGHPDQHDHVSFALAGDEQKVRDAGATAYLAKPYSPRDLLEMIRRLLPEGEEVRG